ncbi:MAG: aspartate aminotransferase family protein [Alphaproteobacteria bacterium]|jgi:acetylornithine/N-succinyldiaminopimelate aminotransferase|nr:aspartate aminotransferase family protein [Alphaproteobacteria bacterium]PPR57049.1 MAG: Acetylornithine aminotransferase [Alphaproteobacteria bacterium MarineAlpha5_Bin3]
MKHNVNSYIMPTYGERTLDFKEGKGVYLISTDNKKYLDFGSGIAVNSLGHCHPKLIQALQEQSSKLWHISNLYSNTTQEAYAKLLCQNSFAQKVFFTNSGAEAVECGLKVIRSYHHFHKNNNKKNIITFEGAFHGRTFAALSAQKNKKFSKGFEPLLSGFIQIPFNDCKAIKDSIDENTGGVMIEPIQGEGGVRPANLHFLEQIRKLCDEMGILFFLDEVQCGFGRTGKFFAYEWANFEPDIMAVAKGIGSGFPLGACLSTQDACIGMTKGTHGSTYGGNPLAVAVGKAVIEEMMQKGFFEKVEKIARYLWNKLKLLEKNYNEIEEVRGAGLLLGIKTRKNNLEIIKLFTQNGLLTVPADDNIIRLAPPLIILKKEVDEAIDIIEKTLQEIDD